MSDNRMDDLLAQENEAEVAAIAELQKLARAHGAESRAADTVAEGCLLGRFRFTPSLGWLEWNGGKWDQDDIADPRVHEVVRQFIDTTERDYRVQAAEIKAQADEVAAAVMGRIAEADKYEADGSPKDPVELFRQNASPEEARTLETAKAEAEAAEQQADMWLNLLSAAKIASVTRLCRGMEGVLTRTTDFDAHPDLLNCKNGVVELPTGHLLPHDPDLLLTHMAGGDYIPGAKHPLWDKALQAVPEELQRWFQARMGQSLTGHTPDDDALIIAAGGGENGKSVIMSAVMRASGSYGRLISHRVLIAQPGQHPTELMDLRGLRFALLEETPEEGHLDTHQLKTTIGTPYITARRMRRDDVTFKTTHSLWVNTNYLPQVDTTDHGTWRRLKAMPFPYRFVKPGQAMRDVNDRPGDLTLKPKLATEEGVPEAVISWIVTGAMSWYVNDRIAEQDPDAVVIATDRWREGSDVAFMFAREHLLRAPGFYITGDAMKKAFGEFLEEQGKRPWSAKTMNTRLPDAMVAAGARPDTDVSSSVRIKEGEQASPWEPPTPVGAWAPPDWQRSSSVSTLSAGDKARIWRGVRFKTAAERREDATGLRAV